MMMPDYDSTRLYGTENGVPASDEKTTELAPPERCRAW